MDYAVLILQWTFDEQEFASCYGQPVAFVEVWSDDHVGDAGLIFHGKKNEALRCSGTLAGDNAACCADNLTILAMFELRRRKHILLPQLRPAIVHRVPSYGESGPGIVGCQPFACGHLLEW